MNDYKIKNYKKGDGGGPKYQLFEIAEMLGISHRLLSSKFGNDPNAPKIKIQYLQKRYYDKNEVISWYKKITNK